MGVDHINEVVGITGWESTLYNLPNEMLNFRYTLWLEVKVLSSSLKTVVFSSLAEFRGLPSIPLKKKKKAGLQATLANCLFRKTYLFLKITQ